MMQRDVRPGGGGSGQHVPAQDEPGVAHDDEDEIHAHGPERADRHDAADALRLEDAVAETGLDHHGIGGSGVGRGADRDGSFARRDSNVDVADVEGG